MSETSSITILPQNLDTNQTIEHSDTDVILPLDLPSSITDLSTREEILDCLAEAFCCEKRRDDPEWTLALAEHIVDLVVRRLQHVNQWVHSNIARFPAEHADIQELCRQLAQLSRQVHSETEICGTHCSKCRLLCIKGRRHNDVHDCRTDHRCSYQCSKDSAQCGFRSANIRVSGLKKLLTSYTKFQPRR